MQLTEIINTYQTKLAENPENARNFILSQFFGDRARVLNRRYIGLFMCEGDGTGYDAINHLLYEVDPELQSIDFVPENREFVLFQKQCKINDPQEQGMKQFVQQLQVVGSDEVLDSHIYEPDNQIAKDLISDDYRGVVAFADMKVSQAKFQARLK